MRKTTLIAGLISLILLLVTATLVAAKEATPVFDDPAYEARFKNLASELRCVKCQNQSLEDSPAGIADDLRREVHEQMQEGKTDNEIVDFLVSKYGDYIRYRPAFNASTILLWVGPFILFITGLVVLFFLLTKRRNTVDEKSPLSEEERNKVAALLNAGGRGGDKKA